MGLTSKTSWLRLEVSVDEARCCGCEYDERVHGDTQNLQALEEALELLEHGRQTLTDPKNWTRRTLAGDASGDSVGDATSEEATCWCMLGALCLARGIPSLYGGGLPFGIAKGELDAASREIAGWKPGNGPFGTASFNDSPGRTHEEVLAAYTQTIERMKARIEAIKR